MTTPKIKRRAKHELGGEKPTIWIGKHGVSQDAVAEVNRQLERTEIVKVKILKTSLKRGDARAVADATAQKTESCLVEVQGHTFILCRRNNRTAL